MRPGRDEKILAGWNGLMVRGIAEAARAFNDDDFAHMATRSGEFLFQSLVRDGRVMRTYKEGVAKIPGFLHDERTHYPPHWKLGHSKRTKGQLTRERPLRLFAPYPLETKQTLCRPKGAREQSQREWK